MSLDHPSRFVDTNRYPVLDFEKSASKKKVEAWKNELKETGVCVLEGFLTPEAVKLFVEDSKPVLKDCFHNAVVGSAYLEKVDENLPADHPKRMTDTTALGVLAYDQFKQTDGLYQLYNWQNLTDFIAAIVGRGYLYHYACPFGALNLSVMKNQDYLRWHFDQADFVVSIPLQDSERGGSFEFVRHIRTSKEENFSEVAKVLKGDRSRVEVLKMPPGSLALFEGRYTIHRVSKIEGATPRLVALLAYDTQPYTNSSDFLKLIRYGRTK